MTKKQAVSAPVRRRVFTAEFKPDMVRQFEARRAQGVSQAQIALRIEDVLSHCRHATHKGIL